MSKPVLHYAKRLADYVRLSLETGSIKENSPVAIAYKDFMAEWDEKDKNNLSVERII